VSFDASASSDPDGDVLRYDWDFGDGESLDDGGPTPSHTYGAQGDYTATVVVTDGDASDGDYTIASIDAANLPPTADAGGPYSGLAGQDILFDGTGSDDAEGPIALYEWAIPTPPRSASPSAMKYLLRMQALVLSAR
jgi:PKD repeat protein